ncbi:DUF2285 domain-containing protein [Asticcacaulis endophyticus]|uniref:DUF2285 domain-containing protein n=1 Tax=Asticcacaulis endophyticus TaxID=1395890 RepID=A0A918Q3G7_9CAUL|nr:DUF2285 domain-containing protein [Asticcacaulis endophyticus]GGZ32596.1 hypothetical protein GCM10011273_18460 [Asticcacaulis endophyticus]
MYIDTTQWRSGRRYDFFDTLPANGLAWECLRRNEDYQKDFAEVQSDVCKDEPARHDIANRWGLLSPPIDPECTAVDVPIYWAPDVDAGTVMLAKIAVPDAGVPLAIAPRDLRQDTSVLYGTVGDGQNAIPLAVLPPADDTQPLSVVIPLTEDVPDRLVGITRLWLILKGLPAPDRRITPDRRRRLQLMLRACDGRKAGATHREIAEAIYGKARIDDELWKTSSLRFSTARLVTEGMRMIHGGYRDLLRVDRSDKRYRPHAVTKSRRRGER